MILTAALVAVPALTSCAPTVAPQSLVQEAYLKSSDPGSGDTFGFSLGLSGATLVVGAVSEDCDLRGVNPTGTFNDGATNSGAAYTFSRVAGSWTLDAYIKASNTQQADNFGAAVAISGDTLVVGAMSEDSAATGVNGDQLDNTAEQSGAVYVFRRGPGGWAQEAYIKASFVDPEDRFGASVAIDGDTLVVGAPEEDGAGVGTAGHPNNNAAARAGAVYVFTRNGTVWTETAYLKASNTEAQDEFGRSVAISGDLLAVGSEREAGGGTGLGADPGDNSAAGAGAVYLFERVAGVWTGPLYVKASNTDAGDGFGQSLALADDMLVVGALREASGATGVNGNGLDDNAPAAGAAYVFERIGGVWGQVAYLKASNTDPADLFARSVATDGARILVGAMGESSNATGIDGDQLGFTAPFSGAAYLFQRAGASWAQQHYLKASNTNNNDWFGYSVGIEADLLVVAAGFEASASPGVNGDQGDNSLLGAGAAYAFISPVELGVTYCASTPNSTGLMATLEALGRPAAVENRVTLRARSLAPASFGYFLASRTQILVPGVGGGQGVLCVGPSIGRYVGAGQVQAADPHGTFALALDLTQTPTPNGLVPVQPGETWNFQAWFRDAGPAGPTSNLSSGLSIDFQ